MLPIAWHAELLTPNPWDLGTQQIEAEIQQFFPDRARVALGEWILTSSLKGRHGHWEILMNQFCAPRFRTSWWGRRCCCKGLDFGRVALKSGWSWQTVLLNFQDSSGSRNGHFEMLLQVSRGVRVEKGQAWVGCFRSRPMTNNRAWFCNASPAIRL